MSTYTALFEEKAQYDKKAGRHIPAKVVRRRVNTKNGHEERYFHLQIEQGLGPITCKHRLIIDNS